MTTLVPGWQGGTGPQGDICEHGGDVGGDYQDGPSWVRRWIDRWDDGTFTVIDFYCFRVAQPDPDGYTGPEIGKLGMSLMVCYTDCTDPDDPGSTEITADTRYWDGIIEDHHDGPAAVLATLGYADIQSAHDQMST